MTCPTCPSPISLLAITFTTSTSAPSCLIASRPGRSVLSVNERPGLEATCLTQQEACLVAMPVELSAFIGVGEGDVVVCDGVVGPG